MMPADELAAALAGFQVTALPEPTPTHATSPAPPLRSPVSWPATRPKYSWALRVVPRCRPHGAEHPGPGTGRAHGLRQRGDPMHLGSPRDAPAWPPRAGGGIPPIPFAIVAGPNASS